jgi:hypothetical protein
MPAERSRLRPVGVRDRGFLLLTAAAAVATAVVVAVLRAQAAPARPGCVLVTKPGFMGAQTSTVCRRSHSRSR